MKNLLFILIFFPSFNVFAQEDPAELAIQLTRDKNSELEKVRSIFFWITENISYKTGFRKNTIIGKASFKNYDNDDDDGPLKSVNERVSANVLKKREAVCDGYARLFTTLCGYAGIRSEVIVGYARATNASKQRFAVNHYWNGVLIDNKWYLLDATWASGYLTVYGDQFVRSYDPDYFLSPPEVFIRDHYPDDARWTLLEDDKVPEEFRRSPFKQKSFTKYSFQSFYPTGGIINTYVGDTIRVKLETTLADQNRDVCPDLLVDSAIYNHSDNWVFVKPEKGNRSNEYIYTYNVKSADIQWLYVMYNDDMVLRYKVNVTKK